MKQFITLLMALLLCFGNGVAAYASVGEPYGVGYANPHELAVAITASFKKDPKGVRPVAVARCLPNGYSCASAQQYLEGFQRADPGAKNLRTVADLPAYLETLVQGQPEGEYWMSCLQKGTMTARWNCLSRTLLPGERAWKNPATGRYVLAGHCTNPMGMPVKVPCLEQDVWLEVGDEHHIGLLGPDAMPDSVCLAILKAGETEWNNVVFDECPRCNFDGPSHDLGLTVQRFTPQTLNISYRATRAGWHRLRMPASMLTTDDILVNCVIRPDGTQSRGMIIAKRHYRRGVAYLGYEGRTKAPDGGFIHTFVWDSARVPMTK